MRKTGLCLGTMAVLAAIVAIPAFSQSQFVKALGGASYDYGFSVVEVSDGGLVVTGYTNSYGAGSYDLLLAKFDGSGNHLWTRTLGGASYDEGYSVVEASDGGLVLTGRTVSYGGGSYDLLLTKFDGSGNHLWTRTLGGFYDDYGFCVVEASDGGFVVTGGTWNYGQGWVIHPNLLLAKFDCSGNVLWTRTLGDTSGGESGRCVVEAFDGGLVLTGWTWSYGAGYEDVLLAKFDGSGNHLWTRTLGGADLDIAMSVVEVSDKGVVVAGYTYSYGAGYCGDFLLAKFDGSGNHLWTRILGDTSGGEWNWWGRSVAEVSDGGLVVTGETHAAGEHSLFLAKFDGLGNNLWTRTLGERWRDAGASVVEVFDEGFLVTGCTWNFVGDKCNLLLAKFGTNGSSCMGTFVTPDFDAISPQVNTIDLAVTSPEPDTATWNPIITSPDPILTIICPPEFIRGDYDCDGQVSTNDPLMMLQHIFGVPGAAPPSCEAAADFNGDDSFLTNDPLSTLCFIFGVPGTCPPPPPYPDCGPDPTPFLSCEWHEYCMGGKALAYRASVSIQGAENSLLVGEVVPVDGVVRVPVELTVTEVVCGFDISLRYDASSLRLKEVVGGDAYDFYAVDTREEGIVRIGGVPDIEMADLMEAGTHRIAEILFTVEDSEADVELKWEKVEVYGANVQALSVEWVDGVVKAGAELPKEFALRQNYPNPFNPTTQIKYDLPVDCHVKLTICNILSQRVSTLVDGKQEAGYKAATWDASSLSSGIYFYRLQAGDFVQTRKMVLIR